MHHPDKLTHGAGPDGMEYGAGDNYFVYLKLAQDTLLDPVKRFAYDRFGPEILNWGSQEKTMQDFLYSALQRSVVPQYVGGFLTILFLNFTWWSDWGRYVGLLSFSDANSANDAVALLHLCGPFNTRTSPNHPTSHHLHAHLPLPSRPPLSYSNNILPPPLPTPHPRPPSLHNPPHLHLPTHAPRPRQGLSAILRPKRQTAPADDAKTGAIDAALARDRRGGYAVAADGVCAVSG